MLELYWTRHKFWIIAGVFACFNAVLAGSLLVDFWKYVASHPGSPWTVYLLLLPPMAIVFMGVFVLYRTMERERQMREQRLQDLIQQQQQLAEDQQQLAEAALRALEIAMNERPGDQPIANVANPAAVPWPPPPHYRVYYTFELPEDTRTPEERANAKLKAKANLLRVVKALNCRIIRNTEPMYELTTKDGSRFVVDPAYIYRCGPIRHEITCYQVEKPCPLEEKMATALLQLNRNPQVFDFFKNFHGHWVS